MKNRSTKSALLLSVVSLMLCFSMLLGTTFAWFTDSAASKGNKITAGTLDVDLYMWTGADEANRVEITDTSAPIFGGENSLFAQNDAADTLWEPGKTQVVYLSIKNNGSLDLKYKVALDVQNPANGKNLYEVMQYSITPDATYGQVTAWGNGIDVVVGTNATQANNVVLKANEEHFFALSVHMDEDATNEYMGGSVVFDINVLAGQLSSEKDSFDETYDVLAPYAGGAFVVGTANLEATASEGETVELANVEKSFSVSATAGAEGKVTADITPINTTDFVFKTASDTGRSVLSYDIDVNGQATGTDVTVGLFVGKNLKNVEVYHDGVLMTSGISYSPSTGFVTIVTADFSPFEVVFHHAEDVPLAKVTRLDTTNVTATLGMNNQSSAANYELDIAYRFATTQSYEDATTNPYAKYHADFVVSANKDVAANAIALIGYYEAYCKDYNGNNWVALTTESVIPANTEIRLLDVLFGGDGTGMANGSVNYEELCQWIPEFDCGVSGLDDSVKGTTITVELRLYEVEEPSESNNNSWNKETGEYLSVVTYTYTFN